MQSRRVYGGIAVLPAFTPWHHTVKAQQPDPPVQNLMRAHFKGPGRKANCSCVKRRSVTPLGWGGHSPNHIRNFISHSAE
ncbi:hypothetical protein CEXT_107331 [Caerostris extrusa]|uniref:Secreted protein n=1 Tax=Caerostris extrusa TaxID=172846 RepID=A0AAV4VRH2_CAEEX|nr:hypothetical protein CEXT_107331 [Caerostris extrusa]